jgi:hypothetical protein
MYLCKVEVLNVAPFEKSRVRVGIRPSGPIYLQLDNDPTYNIQLSVSVLWNVARYCCACSVMFWLVGSPISALYCFFRGQAEVQGNFKPNSTMSSQSSGKYTPKTKHGTALSAGRYSTRPAAVPFLYHRAFGFT